MPQQPWIGLVHVRPRPGSSTTLENAKGAYAHILALAGGGEEYYRMVQDEMTSNGLEVIEVSDVATVNDYAREGRIFGEIEELLGALSTKHPVQYKTFDTYDWDDS